MATKHVLLPLMVSDYMNGKTLADIVRDYDIPMTTLLYHLNRYYPDLKSIPRKRKFKRKDLRRFTDSDIDDIIEDYNNGLSLKEIGSKYSCHWMTVYRNLKYHDFNMNNGWSRKDKFDKVFGDRGMDDLEKCFADWCKSEGILYRFREELYLDYKVPYRPTFILRDNILVYLYNGVEKSRDWVVVDLKLKGYDVYQFDRNEVISSRGVCFKEIYKSYGF